MRLSTSLGLFLIASVVIVLGVHGWIQLEVEKADLSAVGRRELTLLATAIRGAAESALRDDQEPDVGTLLEQLEMRDPSVDVFIFDEDGALLRSSWGSTGNLSTARRLANHAPRDVLSIAEHDAYALAAIAPLRVGGALHGRLVVLRPGTALEADLAAERRALTLSIGLVVAVLSLVLWVVVRLRVHKPLSRVIAGVRRIREGDLSTRVEVVGHDELAELGREFDAMAEALQEARLRLANEAENREKLEVEMQRANRLAVVGEIAATLAHEIGSPLQVLNGRSRDLASRTDLPPNATRSAAILVEQTERIHQIVEQLLDLARRKAPKIAEFDAREPVRRVVELVSTQARRSGVRLEVDTKDVPRLEGDQAQVQQVVLNLLQNAIRASPEGSVVRVSVSSASFERPSDSSPQASVAITVDDEGRGIPDAIKARIFEPFFTAWNDDVESKGTGLGLAVVKSIVTDHGGLVTVTAPPSGVGARFVVHFPVHRTATRVEAP